MYDLLSGMRVVECAAFVAGPSCALHLAQWGADVIRIDQIGGGPDFRRWPLSAEGASFYWEGLNKTKRSVALDLSRPEGRELALQIATAGGKDGGLLVTNYPVEGFLAYDRLKARREDLICVRIMGWPDGRPAVDYTVNAAVGVPLITGWPDDPRPVNHVLPAWDITTGAYAAFSLLAAERARRVTGEGREVRIALSDVAIATLGALGQIGEAQMTQDRPRVGNDLFGAFGRDFVTLDGVRLMVVAITPRQWAGLIKVLDIGDEVQALEVRLGESFARDEGARFRHCTELGEIITAAFSRQGASQLHAALEAESVCWGRHQTLAEAVSHDPYFSAANPILSEIVHPSGYSYLAAGSPARISGLARAPVRPAPALGQDTNAVLSEVLGLSEREIVRLHSEGLVADAVA